MRLGIFLPQAGGLATPAALRDVAQAAEGLGFDGVWAGDHLVLPLGQREPYPFNPAGQFPVSAGQPWLAPFTLLAYLAGQTARIGLGISVCILPYRHPIENAKLAADLDVLSGGRFRFGVGAGWWAEEFQALGVPFAERGARTDEQLEAIGRLWRESEPAFAGHYYAFPPVALEPKPVQQPRPPLWVGGNAFAAARRAGRYADAWHPAVFGTPPERAAAGLAAARVAAEAVGRDPDAVTLAMWMPAALTDGAGDAAPGWESGTVIGTPAQLTDTLRAYASVGATDTVLVMGGSPARRVADMERIMREVAPALA